MAMKTARHDAPSGGHLLRAGKPLVRVYQLEKWKRAQLIPD